ncbi:efflux RND transporter permease subunit [Pseudoalteromonas piscicida]|uniref:efflux RND transporter permease subunit n=1 Tax=Pseudoalteromonas piscicida TaxID=43662 RepID=UPI000E35BB23|nr:efflux RND transporter permease subunit [Pseudoalteromonas piscicida]AXQ99552.1 efflux RND transporter permease subunit [Pseudoalteromonas piscicida]
MAGTWGAEIGARALNNEDIPELTSLLKSKVLAGIPDTNAYPRQTDLLSAFSENGMIQLNIYGNDYDIISDVASNVIVKAREVLPGSSIYSSPTVPSIQPEIIVTPISESINRRGLSENEVVQALKTSGTGLYIKEYYADGDIMKVYLRTTEAHNPSEIGEMPFVSNSGENYKLNEVLKIEQKVGYKNIVRVNKERTVTINIFPRPGQAVEEVVSVIDSKIKPYTLELLNGEGGVFYKGSADSLQQAIDKILKNIFVAVLILFVFMCAALKSIKDSFVVMLTLPVSIFGGVLGLFIANQFYYQSLDLITIIGFVILVGLVVNNSIMLISRFREVLPKCSSQNEALIMALEQRAKPILMSTLTSVFGMLPLVVISGEGSSLYRGLAVVIISGMTFSMIFSIVMVFCSIKSKEKRA